MLTQLDLHHCVGVLERLHRIAVGNLELLEKLDGIGETGKRRLRVKRLAAIDQGRQLLVIDIDQRGGILGDRARMRDDHDERFADIAGFRLRQNEGHCLRPELPLREGNRQPRLSQQARHRACRVTRDHAGQRERRVDIDSAEPRMRQ